jgi:hypothetical protein
MVSTKLARKLALAVFAIGLPLGLHWSFFGPDWHGGDGVVDRPQSAQRGEQRVRLCRIAHVIGLHDHERLAADGLGDLLDWREVEQPADRGQLVRDLSPGQLGPGVQHLRGALDRVPQGTRTPLGDREQPELERGDDAEADTRRTTRTPPPFTLL